MVTRWVSKVILLSTILVTVVLLAGSTAMAAHFDVPVGDKDGYGIIGYSDSGTCLWPGPGPSGTNYDGRDAAEIAATSGAQITDVYSAIFLGAGPNPNTASVIFPSVGTITSATLTVAMGDFQAAEFGAIMVDFNGIAEDWAFEDGFQVTTVRSFTLSAAEIGAANRAGQFQINLDHNNSRDFIAFDWFELSGTSTAVPEPSTLLLLGSGLVGLAGLGWRRAR